MQTDRAIQTMSLDLILTDRIPDECRNVHVVVPKKVTPEYKYLGVLEANDLKLDKNNKEGILQ